LPQNKIKPPIISLLHANYCAEYLWDLMDIYSSDEVYDATEINILEFKKIITDIQDNTTKNINKYLLKLGKEN